MNKCRLSFILACVGFAAAAIGCDDSGGTPGVSHIDGTDIITDQVICNQGENRCVDARMEVCASVKWILAMDCGKLGCNDATNACNLAEGQEAPECYVTICDSDRKTLKKCDAGKVVEEVCPEGSSCVGTSCIECLGEDVRCRDGNVYECKDNKWQMKETCSDGMVCDANTLTCRDKSEAAECVNGAKECDGNGSAKSCQDGHWVVIPCLEGESCVDGACAGACTDGEKACNGDKYQHCEGGKWVIDVCSEEQVCTDDGCVASAPEKLCQSGEKICAEDASAVLVCAEDGMSYVEDKVCAELGDDYVCDATIACVKAEDAKVCVDGQTNCAGEGQGYVPCVDGNWGTEITMCTGAQICADGVCVDKICSDGDIKCAGAGYVKCIGNAWDDVVNECAEGEACMDKDGVAACSKVVQAVCKDSEIQCDATDKQHRKYVSCVDGQWSAESSACADGKICENGACVAPCINGDTKCADGESLQTCSNGLWGDAAACPANESCSNGSCVCKAGAKKCDGKGIVTCGSNGKWLTDNAEKCKQGCDIASESPVCFECNNNEVQCTGAGEFQICVDHKWQTYEKCGGKQCWGSKQNGSIVACQCGTQNQVQSKCSSDGSAIESCVTRTVEVNGDKFTYRGGWETTLTCDGGKCESDNGKTICSCKGNASKCEGNTLYNCQKLQWVEVDVCKDGMTCDPELNACICKEGDYRCSNQASQVCKDGKWIEARACTRSEVCRDDEGGVCARWQCADSQSVGNITTSTVCASASSILKCENGHYVDSETCGSNQVCRISSGMGQSYAQCANNSSSTCYRQGEKRCSADGKSMEECKRSGMSMKWTATACAENQVCTASGNGQNVVCSAKVCDNYTYSCKGDKIVFCNANAFEDYADCAQVGRTCKDGHCVAK